jgi:hypothetical protein
LVFEEDSVTGVTVMWWKLSPVGHTGS